MNWHVSADAGRLHDTNCADRMVLFSELEVARESAKEAQGENQRLQEEISRLLETNKEMEAELVVLKPAARMLDGAWARADEAEARADEAEARADEAGESMERAATTVQTTLECMAACILSSKAAGLSRINFVFCCMRVVLCIGAWRQKASISRMGAWSKRVEAGALENAKRLSKGWSCWKWAWFTKSRDGELSNEEMLPKIEAKRRARCCVEGWRENGLTASFESWGKVVRLVCQRRRGDNCLKGIKSLALLKEVILLEEALEEAVASKEANPILLSKEIIVMGSNANGHFLEGRLQRHKMCLVLETIDDGSAPRVSHVVKKSKQPVVEEKAMINNHSEMIPAADLMGITMTPVKRGQRVGSAAAWTPGAEVA